jgi:hypothetical protein
MNYLRHQELQIPSILIHPIALPELEPQQAYHYRSFYVSHSMTRGLTGL